MKKYSVTMEREREHEVLTPFVFVSKHEMAEDHNLDEHHGYTLQSHSSTGKSQNISTSEVEA